MPATLRPPIAVALAITLLCGGCSLFRPTTKEAPLANIPPPATVPLPQPEATHYFAVDPNSDLVGYLQRVTVGKDDTLPDIARRFDVGYEEMVTANPGVDPWLPGAGREVVIPTQFVLPVAPHEGVVVNVAEMRIFYYPKHKKDAPETVYTYPIGIGRVGWKTPEGSTKIGSRQKAPVWVVPKSVRAEHLENGEKLPGIVPAGPDNPLGQYLFRLGWPSYLIHGTNKPYGVGMRSSHGCLRLYPEDIAMFFDLVPIGTKVTVVNQPYVFGWRDGALYLQVYAPMEDDARNWTRDHKKLLAKLVHPRERGKIAGHDAEIDWERVADLAHQPRAVPVPITGQHDGLDVILSTSRLVQNSLPQGSNWDGKSGLLVDEKTFNDLVGARDKVAIVPPASATPSSQAAVN